MNRFLHPSSSNVIRFPTLDRAGSPPTTDPGAPWRALTHALVMEKHRRGELEPGIVEALLVAAGVAP
jgi:hypothetical protein